MLLPGTQLTDSFLKGDLVQPVLIVVMITKLIKNIDRVAGIRENRFVQRNRLADGFQCDDYLGAAGSYLLGNGFNRRLTSILVVSFSLACIARYARSLTERLTRTGELSRRYRRSSP